MVMALQPFATGLNPETGQDENLLAILAERRKNAAGREAFTPGMKEILARDTAAGGRGAVVAAAGALSGGLQGYFNRQDAAAEQRKLQQNAIAGAAFLRKADPKFAKLPAGYLEQALMAQPSLLTTLTGKAFEEPNYQVVTGPEGPPDPHGRKAPGQQYFFNPKSKADGAGRLPRRRPWRCPWRSWRNATCFDYRAHAPGGGRAISQYTSRLRPMRRSAAVMDLHDKAWKAESYQRYAKAAPIMASIGQELAQDQCSLGLRFYLRVHSDYGPDDGRPDRRAAHARRQRSRCLKLCMGP